MSRSLGPDNIGKAPLESRNDIARIVDAECSLRHIGHRYVVGQCQRRNIVLGRHQMHGRIDLAHGPLDFRMAGMSDQDQGAALPGIALALGMDLRHQRTGRIKDRQAPRCASFTTAWEPHGR